HVDLPLFPAGRHRRRGLSRSRGADRVLRHRRSARERADAHRPALPDRAHRGAAWRRPHPRRAAGADHRGLRRARPAADGHGAGGTAGRLPLIERVIPWAPAKEAAMRRHPIALGVVLALVVISSASAAPPRDTMVIGLVAEPVTMDPPQITDLNSTRVAKRIFEGLVGQELGTYKLVPGLARSWDISKDGLTYTFHLRPDVTFHDGTPLTADAVRFVFERQLNEQSPYYKTGTYPYVKGFLGNVASLETIDPHTVQIRLKAPLTPFIQYLAHHSLYIYSPESLKKWGTDVVKHPVG